MIATNCLGEYIQLTSSEDRSQHSHEVTDDSISNLQLDGKTKYELQRLIDMKREAVEHED